MNQPTTVLEWFELLDDDIRDRAQAYACYCKRDSVIVDCLCMAIFWGIKWHRTVEGFDYWCEFRVQLYNIEESFNNALTPEFLKAVKNIKV